MTDIVVPPNESAGVAINRSLKFLASQETFQLTPSFDMAVECPLCHTTLLENLDFDDVEKLNTWSFAQVAAFVALAARSGIDLNELLKTASDGEGYVAIPNFHGMYVGIERDGYTHS